MSEQFIIEVFSGRAIAWTCWQIRSRNGQLLREQPVAGSVLLLYSSKALARKAARLWEAQGWVVQVSSRLADALEQVEPKKVRVDFFPNKDKARR